MNKIIVTGHPYAFPYYFKVFEYLENKDDFIFILPKLWLAKQGKVRIRLEPKQGFSIYGLKAMSYGGHLIAGLFKGWLPGMIFLLPHLKIKFGSRILYSCSELNPLTTLYNGLIAKILGLKLVLFTWQNIPPETRLRGFKLKLSNALVRLNLKLADGIICGNRKAAKIVEKFKIQNSKFKILVCPLSGVDIEKFRPGIRSNWREQLNIKPEEKLILFYGALDKRKGLDVLIDAFYFLNAKRYTLNAKLVIVGTGSEQENLKLQTTNYALQTKVIFLDWMPNDQLPALLNAADVFVYPSVPSGGWEEQFGYAMAEASACGVPVVATRSGSIDEVVVSGQSGILAESNNPEQLVEAFSRILSDNGLAKQMGEYGRRCAVENFSHQVIADKIAGFLFSFLK